ncbi:MAG: lysostaphin resistance A-like protein, partial [Lachnospiraceae bacterium]
MKRKYAVDANRLFLISIAASQLLLPLVAALGVSDVMMLQFLIEVFMVLPCVIYLCMQRCSAKDSVGLNSLCWQHWLLLLPLAVCVDKIAEFINILSQLFAPNVIGNHMAELILEYPLPLAFFVIAVTPAVCEELIYRGVIYQGYRRSSVRVAVLLSAFLFGIMHMNLNQFCYAMVLGILFSLVNEAVGSLVPSMLLHLYINGRSVVLLYAAVNYLTGLREQYVTAEAAGNTALAADLLEQAQGVPIDSAEWLTAYFNMGETDVAGGILTTLPWFLLSVLGVVLIVRYFVRSTGRAEHFRTIFTGRKPENGGERETNSVISPALVVGSLF